MLSDAQRIEFRGQYSSHIRRLASTDILPGHHDPANQSNAAMNYHFLHQNFPARFRHIVAHFAADSVHRVVAIGEAGNLKRATGLHPQIELRPYPAPQSAASATHSYLQGYEAAIHRGLQCARLAS